ncbi:MAG: glycosyltransferase [Candidatus Heimdallarchaeota archaeon]
MNSIEEHAEFLENKRKHILMITNHGIHEWEVIPGLTDTGGQNVYVNYFTQAMTKIGYKVTITNRGGYPHPQTAEIRQGLDYKDESQRILYLEDEVKEFVRKEDMAERIPQLAHFLQGFLKEEGSQVDLVISHYWDGAKLGCSFIEAISDKIRHFWVPHSVGTVKKRNVHQKNWENLRIAERIEIEKQIIKTIDGAAATSTVIREALQNDYGCGNILFLPPCIDTDRFYPRDVPENHKIWDFLSEHSGLSAAAIKRRNIVTEISRTDTTKRKNVVIQSFSRALKVAPQSFLVLAIDNAQKELFSELTGLIETLNIAENVAVVGSIWDLLPWVYGITDVYISPSVMEGFGMAVQEAAATKAPIIASDLIPFAVEYLLGENPEQAISDSGSQLLVGDGAIVVESDDITGFSDALKQLLTDEKRRKEMGENAYSITIPYFTWQNMVKKFLEDIKFS